MWLGLVGSNGAGKSAACDYLAAQGFTVSSLSYGVRRAAREKGLPCTRDNLIAVGSQLKADFGPDVLAQRCVAAAKAQSNVVFDSIRHSAEAEFLKQNGVILIGIDAPLALRYERIKSRQNDTDQVTFEEFKAHDELETNGESPGQNIGATLKLCDFILENDADLAAFQTKLSQLVAQLKERV